MTLVLRVVLESVPQGAGPEGRSCPCVPHDTGLEYITKMP